MSELQLPSYDERGATMDNVKPLTDKKREETKVMKRWALLVGVNKYVDPHIRSLDYCVNDVLAMEELLQRANYEVVALHDEVKHEYLLPTRDNVEGELRQLCQKAQPDDLVLVYFATHGKLVDGKPCLITREIRHDALAGRALPLSTIIEITYKKRIKRRVLLLDACYSGVDMTRDLIVDDEFIHDVYELAEGTALLAATTAQDKALEHKELKHGLFTNALLTGIEGQADHEDKGFVTVDDLKKHVQHTLTQWNYQHETRIQQPTFHIQGFGDMILADYRTTITRNPFGDRGRITDPKRFFDRKELMRQIFEELGKGMSVSLVGEPQIGKSSILSMICEWGPEKLQLPKNSFIYIDLQLMGLEDDFYEVLCEHLKIETCSGVKLDRALRGKRYILCLDHMEKMVLNEKTKRVHSNLRGLAERQDAPLSLIIASRKPLADLFPNFPRYTSPLANICRLLDVFPFSPQIARNFLFHRLRGTNVTFNQKDIKLLLRYSCCHPAKLQNFSYKLFRHLT